MSDVNPFDAAVKTREAEKIKENEKGDGGGGFDYSNVEQIEWAGLEDYEKPFRFVGFPPLQRTMPWHSKILYQSEIVNDKGDRNIRVNWVQTKDMDGKPSGDLDKNWILHKLLDEVFVKKWEDYPEPIDGKKGKYVFLNSNTATYKRMKRNRKDGDNYPHDGVFKSSKKVIAPVIDRGDDWCKENKHIKLLSRKIGTGTNKEGVPIFYPQIGVHYGVGDFYKGCWIPLMDNIVLKIKDEKGNVKSWEEYDIVINRDGNKDYRVTHGGDIAVSDQCKEKIVTGPLTDEEKAYEHYDLDTIFIFQETSYTKLFTNLEKLFLNWKAESGSRLYDELVTLAGKEKTDREADKARAAAEAEMTPEQVEESRDDMPLDMGADTIQAQQEKVEARKEEAAKPVEEKVESAKRRKKTEPVEVKGESLTDQCVAYFPKWVLLPDEQQGDMVKAIESFKDGFPVYKEGQSFVCNDDCFLPGSETERTKLGPNTFMCPVCGTSWEVEETNGI